jgi:ubiquinone/menaquinone biosynthesis C-methylase UbiE
MSMDYDAWAEWYDVFYSTAGLDDVEFYVDLAVLSGGPVLEIGCGTGRVTLPVAAAGVDIVGVDFSPAMLVKAEKRAATTSDLGGSYEFVHGDMRTLALDRLFPLVVIPARTLYLALTPEEQVETLRRAASHMAPGGILAFNLFTPDPDLLADTSEDPFAMGEIRQPATAVCSARSIDPTRLHRRSTALRQWKS